MCFNSGKKAARRAEAAANRQIAEQSRIHAEQMAQQATIHADEVALRNREMEENKRQNAIVAAELERQRAINERPAPPQPGPSAVEVTGGTPEAENVDGEPAPEEVTKKGRKGLRIDMASAGGATGLNVPRG